MKSGDKNYEPAPKPLFSPATSLDDREGQLISLAYDVAEERLRNGTATSQEVTHFLKLGSSKARVEKDILERQKELITAKTEALQAQKKLEEMFSDAMEAFRRYSGDTKDEEL